MKEPAVGATTLIWGPLVNCYVTNFEYGGGSDRASHPAAPGSTPFPRFIEHHSLVSEQWQSNEPI